MSKVKRWFLYFYDILKKPETIIALFIAIVGSLVSNFAWINIHPEYEPTIPIRQLTAYFNKSQILLKNNLISPNLTIKYKDNEINQIMLYEFTFQNTGIETINISDYDSSIMITAQNSSYLFAEVTYSNNSIIKKQVSDKILIEGQQLLLPNVMLNSNDYYTISLIMDGTTSFNINGRINGISSITIQDRSAFAQMKARHLQTTRVASVLLITMLIFFFLLLVFVFGVPYIKGLKLKKQLERKYKISISRKLTSQISLYSKIIETYADDEDLQLFFQNKTNDDFLAYFLKSKTLEHRNSGD